MVDATLSNMDMSFPTNQHITLGPDRLYFDPIWPVLL